MDQRKKVLITGASHGIGKMMANYFAGLGFDIIMTYYSNLESVNKIEEELTKKYQINVDSYYLDLRQEECILKLHNNVKEKYGIIDCLINNAAISCDNYILDKTKDEFMKVLEINTVGTFLMMKYFDSIVDGYIFNISSTDGIDTGSVYSVDYNASKAAINALSKTFSLISHNRIVSICPNWVDTDSTRAMNKDYLTNELERIGQKNLISELTIPKVIVNCINEKIPSGSIIRIEGDDDVRRVD